MNSFIGFTGENKFNIPNVTIENLSDFRISTLQDSISIKIIADDDVYTLDRINIWINDIPLFGITGRDISNLNLNSYSTLQNIILSPGKNKIQVSANNSQGYESLKETFYIEFDTEEKAPDLYLVSVGVSKYTASEYDLEYASKDAADMSEMFKSNKKGFF